MTKASVDPGAVIVSVVALGAVAGVQESAAGAVRDAYQALKRLISERYGSDVDVAAVERRLDSETKRESLAEDLSAAGADEDPELSDAARRLIEQVKNHQPTVAPAVGIDLERVQAGALNIDRRVVPTRPHRPHHLDRSLSADRPPLRPRIARARGKTVAMYIVSMYGIPL